MAASGVCGLVASLATGGGAWLVARVWRVESREQAGGKGLRG